MPHAAAARMATRERDAGRYQRHRPEQTLRSELAALRGGVDPNVAIEETVGAMAELIRGNRYPEQTMLLLNQ